MAYKKYFEGKLTSGQVAELLRCSAQTVINLSETRKLPCTRIGTSPRCYSIKDVKEYIDKHKLKGLNPFLYEKLFNNKSLEHLAGELAQGLIDFNHIKSDRAIVKMEDLLLEANFILGLCGNKS